MITSCRTITDMVTDYLEDTLEDEQRMEFEQHLALCPPCRGHLLQMRATLRAAHTLRDDVLAPELRSALLERFAEWQGDAPE
jgi:anti-sigma factor RsiW